MADRMPLPRVMVSPTGARRTKADHPALPMTTAEIVAAAGACHDAGADGIHLHIRDADGRHSIDPGQYRETMAELERAVPDLFIQVTSEAAGSYGADDQRALMRELHPRSVSVAVREMLRAPVDVNPARDFYHWAADAGVVIHHISYSAEELQGFLGHVDSGLIPGSTHQIMLVLGSYQGGVLPTVKDLDPYLALVEARKGDLELDWMVCAFGLPETECLADAAARGGKVRVGFENSLWNSDGSLAKDNAERVAEVCAAIENRSYSCSA